MQLFRIKKLTGGRRRQFEPPRRINAMQFSEEPITIGPVRLPKNVEASQPGGKGEAGEKKDHHRPSEIVHSLPRPAIRRLVAEEFPCHQKTPLTLERARRFEGRTAAAGSSRIWINNLKTRPSKGVVIIQS